ncbi:MAG: hypothetical protein IPM56_09990 [Ignavibacteriales bacterium]|nr:MAG: hypothetical protein IPM56_09990 [Ignavibacteriales bacterium]
MVHSKISFNIFFLLFFLVNNFTVLGQNYPDESIHLLLKDGIKKIVQQDYDNALSLFSKMDRDYPQLPLGKIYIAATHIARSYDYGEQIDEKSIEGLLDDAYIQAKSLLDKDSRNLWYNYFVALAEGYSAYFHAIRENYFSAMSSGLSSVDYFENCIELNPEFHEAYIAIGTYRYWKSRKTEFLHWLPFVSDDRDEGVALLENALRRSTYNTHLAINSLIWIYIDQQRPVEAVRLAESILKDYPQCRVFKWGLARAYENIDIKKSIEVYGDILQSFPMQGLSNHFNEIVLKHKIAQQLVKLGEKKKALKLCDEILSIKDLTPYVREQLEDRLERVEILRKELSR